MNSLTQLQSKALTRVNALLDSYDESSDLYKELYNHLTELKLDDPIKNKILTKFNENIFKEKSKLTEASQWINALLNDNK